MCVQSAKEFLQKIDTDQALKERLAAAADQEARQQLLQAAGFDFTLDEFKQAAKELYSAQELTDEELQGIVVRPAALFARVIPASFIDLNVNLKWLACPIWR